MKGICKRVGALLLATALLLSLCACAQGRRQEESNDQKGSAEAVTLPPGTDREAPETQPAQDTLSPEAETALGWLRDRIDFPMTMFGAAYLGYVGGLFDEGFEAGFPAWLWETNEAMLLEYPFIAEIDEEHIIGGAGHLYCIVPVDENATVAINRVQWNEKTQTDEVTEVLYRSESRCCSLQILTALHMRPTPRSLSPTTTGIPVNGSRPSTRRAILRPAYQKAETIIPLTLRSTHGILPRPRSRHGLPAAGQA